MMTAMRRLAVLAAAVALLALAAGLAGGVARADGAAAGWYGPYADGCYSWWSGTAWTGAASCGAAGQAGWVGPAADGCSTWWDGTAYTAEVSCPAAAGTDLAALNQILLQQIVGRQGGLSPWAAPDCDYEPPCAP